METLPWISPVGNTTPVENHCKRAELLGEGKVRQFFCSTTVEIRVKIGAHGVSVVAYQLRHSWVLDQAGTTGTAGGGGNTVLGCQEWASESRHFEH